LKIAGSDNLLGFFGGGGGHFSSKIRQKYLFSEENIAHKKVKW
jgi:hypothetical protein